MLSTGHLPMRGKKYICKNLNINIRYLARPSRVKALNWGEPTNDQRQVKNNDLSHDRIGSFVADPLNWLLIFGLIVSLLATQRLNAAQFLAVVSPEIIEEVKAPEEARVTLVHKKVGQEVNAGTFVMWIHSAGKNIAVHADKAGVITDIDVSVGDSVGKGQVLFTVGNAAKKQLVGYLPNNQKAKLAQSVFNTTGEMVGKVTDLGRLSDHLKVVVEVSKDVVKNHPIGSMIYLKFEK